MEFWVVPNNQGLPTVDAAAIVGDAGLSPHIGKGALVYDNGTTIPSGASGDGTQISIGDDGTEYDDLSFFNAPLDAFVIPDVKPAIVRVALFFQCGWEAGNSTTFRQLRIMQNGFTFNDGPTNGVGMGANQVPGNSINNDAPVNVVTAPVNVSVGDMFTFFGKQNFGGNLSLTNVAAGIWVVR